MGKPTGFLEIRRQDAAYAPAADRVHHYREFLIPPDEAEMVKQGARCMDCGVPFCHQACPVNNLIPDWNDLVFRNRWREALETLHSTNNFPEFTGRICPAPCEAGCTLNINDDPVTIKAIEEAIVEKGWAEHWIEPQIAPRRTGKRIAVIGSGPAGLAAAQQLARAGHNVVVFEKNLRVGGLLRYGIPDFKLEKRVIDRRMAQMQAEGIDFRTGTHVGKDVAIAEIVAAFDAVILAGGSEKPRDLPVPGRDLAGIHFAMTFLAQQNRRVAGEPLHGEAEILATGKHVVVIGGGDTGSDCIGTSIRQGALSVTQIEIMPKPPQAENKAMTWPAWPNKLRTSSSQEEGCERDWSVTTTSFAGKDGQVKSLAAARVEWHEEGGRWSMTNIPNSDFTLKADLVLLAMGFERPIQDGMLKDLGVAFDPRGNVQADTNAYQTSIPKVFAAGDMRRGQSLVVWAIREGRQAARAVDAFLMGETDLPR